MSKPSISPLEPGDRPAIEALVQQTWVIGIDALREESYGRRLGEPWQKKIVHSVSDYLDTAGVEGVVAAIDGCFAGFLTYRIDRENRFGEIGYNAVDPAFRGHGLGKLLLQHALEALRAAGVENVEVVTGEDDGHAAARRLYEGVGFQPFRSTIRYTLALGSGE